MKTINFSFSTKLTFDNYVHDHSFALRCMPVESPVQHIISCEMNISPFVPTDNTVDAFGNTVTAGYIAKDHRFLDFEINGRAEMNLANAKTDFMPCYLYQSEYTKPDSALTGFYNDISSKCSFKSPYERTEYFSDIISDLIIYEKGATDTDTTASEAFRLKKGVCQDFSHVMLSLLRMDKIPCRYIAGLACCNGETHSWIEIWDGSEWIGFDPANNCAVTEEYLVLSQGRDFGDCSVDRGVMFGAYTKQLQLISSQLSSAY